jgi:hypothetical protein
MGLRPSWPCYRKRTHSLTARYNESENVCCFCVGVSGAQVCLIFVTIWFPLCSVDKARDRSLSISVFPALHVSKAALLIC